MMHARWLGLSALLVIATGGCKGNAPEVLTTGAGDGTNVSGEIPPQPPGVPAGGGAPVVIEKELMITDPSVVDDRRASNAAGGPWSFRWHMEQLTPSGVDTEVMVKNWLATYGTSTIAGTPVAARDVEAKLVCPWMRLTPENQCDETCGACAGRKLDLAKAPFKLMAIVNRTDIPEGPCTQGSEGRFVYGGVDPTTGAPIELTVIFEYSLQGGSAMAWARSFHTVAELPFGEAFNERLEGITRLFSENANAFVPRLAHLRTNEHAFGAQWELRQFETGKNGFVPTPLTNTPRADLDNSSDLATHITANAKRIALGDNALESSRLAAVAQTPSESFRWMSQKPNDPASRLFSRNTCNGCHGGEHADDDAVQFRHIQLGAKGETLLSKFLIDPDKRNQGELIRRAQIVSRLLAARSCSDQTGGGYTSSATGSGGGGVLAESSAADRGRAGSFVVH